MAHILLSNCDDFEKYLHEIDDFTTKKGKQSSNHFHGRNIFKLPAQKIHASSCDEVRDFLLFSWPSKLYFHQNYLRQT